MAIPLIVPGIAALALAAYWARKRRDNAAPNVAGDGDGDGMGVMTPARQVVYETALSKCQNPDTLEELAGAFAGQGLKAQAMVLRNRAALRRLTPEQKQARKEAWRKALSSTNKAAVIEMAKLYQAQGCGGAARKLYEYAQGLP
jgi:hypothetical protein